MTAGIAVFALYLGLLAWHAYRGHRASRSVSEFHVGGRQMGALAIGLSFYATFMSTNSFIGLVGLSSVWGLSTLSIGLAFVLFTFVSWHWIAPPLRRDTARLDVLSLPEYLGRRFDSPFYRRAAGGVIVLASVFFLQAVFKGMALVVASLTGLPETWALAISWAIVVAYTVAGGIHAVAATNVSQGTIMLAASALLPIALVHHAGGAGPLFERISEVTGRSFGELWTMAPAGALVGIALSAGSMLLADPRQVNQFLAIRPDRIRSGRRIAIFAVAFSYVLIQPVGLLSLGVIERPSDPDRIVPTLLAAPDIVPPILGAIFLVACASAAMSTIDSVLLVVGATLQRDLLGWVGPKSPVPELLSTRLLILLFSVLPAALVLASPRGIIPLAVFAGSIYAAVFLPPLLFALYSTRRERAASAWAAMWIGLGSLAAWKFLLLPRIETLKGVHEVIPGTALSFAAYWTLRRWLPAPAAPTTPDRAEEERNP